jgi:hypothetical protein
MLRGYVFFIMNVWDVGICSQQIATAVTTLQEQQQQHNPPLSSTKRRPPVSQPASQPLPCKFSPASPVHIHQAVTKKDAATKRPFSGPQHPAPKSSPFQSHHSGILQWHAPLGFLGRSDIITDKHLLQLYVGVAVNTDIPQMVIKICVVETST